MLSRNAILDDPRVCAPLENTRNGTKERHTHFQLYILPGKPPTAGKTQRSNNHTKSPHSASLENPKWKSILERNEKSRNKNFEARLAKKQISNCANTSIYSKQIVRGEGVGGHFSLKIGAQVISRVSLVVMLFADCGGEI